MPLKNQAMLITYADSLGSNLNDLQKVLQGPLKDVVGGVHILPFFPSSGDRGFAPMDYTKAPVAASAGRLAAGFSGGPTVLTRGHLSPVNKGRSQT